MTVNEEEHQSGEASIFKNQNRDSMKGRKTEEKCLTCRKSRRVNANGSAQEKGGICREKARGKEQGAAQETERRSEKS